MKILVIGNMSSEFIKRDYEILKKHFDVEVFDIKYTSPLSYLRKLKAIGKYVKRCDIVFSWFAEWHSVSAVHYSKKYGKKSIVVAGGYDVACVPEIGYGNFAKVGRRMSTKYALKNADLVISVSKSNQKELLERVAPKRNELIYNGIPIEEFYPEGKKKNIVLTVGEVNASNWRRKGLDNFVAAAQYFTLKEDDIKFVVVGRISDDMKETINRIYSSDAVPDIEFTGWVNDENLLEWYQKAKIYLQLSAHEAFGISVAEAMLCECIPVVSDRYALPEVIGSNGFSVPYGSIQKATESIKKALNAPEELGKKARKQIEDMFSRKKREQCLIRTIEGMEIE